MNDYSFTNSTEIYNPYTGECVGSVCEKHTLTGWENEHPDRPIFRVSYKAETWENGFVAEWHESEADAMVDVFIHYGLVLAKKNKFASDLAGISRKG